MPDEPKTETPRDRGHDGTVAIVGAGFSGTALAYRLLRAARFRGRVILIERTGRYGPGLAYGSPSRKALLNVPAVNMSLDERQPADFLDYLRSRGLDPQPHDFVPRHLYGHYLQERLDAVALAGDAPRRLVRVNGEAVSLCRERGGDAFTVAIDDGRRLFADRVVLAVGHAPPATLPALSPLEGSSIYIRDPWATLPACRPGGRVLIIGTGLTMADVICELIDRPGGPEHIVAVSRHGRVPHVRDAALLQRGPDPQGACVVASYASARKLVAATRRAARQLEARGGNWRDVIAGVRVDAARLWANLPLPERRRFLRHAQPFWDVHRHLLPPLVGQAVHAALRHRRLDIRAGRIVAAELRAPGARVSLRARGEPRVETLDVDQVILCTGPPADPTQNPSRLVRELVARGWLTSDPSACGLRVDARGRPIDGAGAPVEGLYYLGPWLRARDWEATAVAELRRAATALVETLLYDRPRRRA